MVIYNYKYIYNLMRLILNKVKEKIYELRIKINIVLKIKKRDYI